MRPVIVIRPEPGCTATARAARDLGLDAHAIPLFAIESRDWAAPDPARFDALLAGSANAFRHGGPGLARLSTLPVHAVGQATADAARQAGFTVASCGSGGLQQVIDSLAAHKRLLRLSGEERVELSPPDDVTIEERIVYASRALPLPEGAASLLHSGAVVLLHSAAAARHFAGECERLGLRRDTISLALIGPRLIDATGPGWAETMVAETPGDTALLALAKRMCQERLP